MAHRPVALFSTCMTSLFTMQLATCQLEDEARWWSQPQLTAPHLLTKHPDFMRLSMQASQCLYSFLLLPSAGCVLLRPPSRNSHSWTGSQ